MKKRALSGLARLTVVALVTTVLTAGCASTGEVADEDDLAIAACPKHLKVHCFKRTAMREECFCVDPDELEHLLDQIGPRGVLDRERDRWD